MSQAGERKIHIRVAGELHRLLRIRCADLDVTIQDYVVRLLEQNLRSVSPPLAGRTTGGPRRRNQGKVDRKTGAA